MGTEKAAEICEALCMRTAKCRRRFGLTKNILPGVQTVQNRSRLLHKEERPVVGMAVGMAVRVAVDGGESAAAVADDESAAAVASAAARPTPGQAYDSSKAG